MLKISFQEPNSLRNKALAIVVAQKAQSIALGPQAKHVDQTLGGALSLAIKATPSFKAKVGQVLSFPVSERKGPDRVVLVGIGKAEEADALTFEAAGAAAVMAMEKDVEGEGALLVDGAGLKKISGPQAAASAAMGAVLRHYRFDKYHSKEKKETTLIKGLVIGVEEFDTAKALFAPEQKVAQSVCFARDLVTEPANVIDPAAMVQAARKLEKLGVEVTVLGQQQMEKLGMRALLGVAQGSDKPPYLVTMSWRGAPEAKEQKPIAFVGKGVTFDSGGISLKPGAGMGDMKFDMGGAAAVVGAVRALAARKAKTNVVGVIGLVENMPSGKAQRPGDVVKSANGQTIEILNTDAEGRLVLADVLWYAQKEFKPKAIVDLATLTGAMLVALGHKYAGIFSNNDKLAASLEKAGRAVDELVWRFPLDKEYDKMIDSTIADMKNIGEGSKAGSITAAQFLKRFIQKDVAWVHIDIAGTAWREKPTETCSKGATGFGVRLLDRLVHEMGSSS
ncbi:MAG: leucyl aminopeptidase [Alphaproteobacteria bacterium]|jgi:leucyl aminopeptidase|nr:leucyl aminopeptidase [Alphaproteobacteria bacterium]